MFIRGWRLLDGGFPFSLPNCGVHWRVALIRGRRLKEEIRYINRSISNTMRKKTCTLHIY